MDMTAAQMARTQAMMSKFSGGEPVTIEITEGTLYVFCSELASLRIFAKYLSNGSVQNPKARVGFSQNMNTHFFSLDVA